MEKLELLTESAEKRFNAKIDFVILHCQNPECDWHWGVSLAKRKDRSLTARDLICQKCAGDKLVEKL